MPGSGVAAGIGSAVGGVVGGIGSLVGGSKASSADTQAANLQQQQYATTRADLLPYNKAGQSVLPNLTSLATSGATGGGPDYLNLATNIGVGPGGQAALEQTPGYQFQLQQGLQSAMSSAAARGLGVSGAEMKGAASYATGVASSNYQQQFQNALNLNTAQQNNLQNQFNRLSGVSSLGANAAATTGQQGTQAAAAGGNYLAQSGLAGAAGVTGVGSAVNQGVQNYLGYQNLQQAINSKTGGYVDSGQFS